MSNLLDEKNDFLYSKKKDEKWKKMRRKHNGNSTSVMLPVLLPLLFSDKKFTINDYFEATWQFRSASFHPHPPYFA